MDRVSALQHLKSNSTHWDIIVIGGGATGLGCAVDAASRGYRTLLVEQHDFAKGTSGRSTKLIHGGVRYLRQGNLSLVFEALEERGYLMKNAPHLVKTRAFIVPVYRWWEKPFYFIGLTLYDLMSGSHGLGRTRMLSADEARAELPTIVTKNLKGGVMYKDGQFDDARLAVNLMQTVFDNGGTALNYLKVTKLEKNGGMIKGVHLQDQESGETMVAGADVVINATGVFTDHIRMMDEPESDPLLMISRGVHIVLDRKFLPGDSAIILPETEDGRVLFLLPWHHKVIVGTTDVVAEKAQLEPKADRDEIFYLLNHASSYLTKKPVESDIRSVYAGLRPLVNPKEIVEKSKSVSREHTLLASPSGLITITGGKWTTYRKMAQDTIDMAVRQAGLQARACVTKGLPIHGKKTVSESVSHLDIYGSDAAGLEKLASEIPGGGKTLHPDLPYTPAEVIGSIRHEMARTVEDVLCRRTRALFLNAEASIEIAPLVAGLMASELHRDSKWQSHQVDAFRQVAKSYLASHYSKTE